MTRAVTYMFLARRRLGMSQAELARRVGVTQPRVSAWETKSADVPKKRRKKIAEILGLNPDYLTEEP